MTLPAPATDSAPSPHVSVWLATVPLIWGTHFVALKVVFEEYGVFGMLTIRYALMIVALLGVLWLTERDLRFAWRDVPYLAGFSLLMVTVYQVVFALGIDLASAAQSALLISTAPMFTAITAAALGWERLTGRLVAGVGLGFAGIFAVIYGGGDLSGAAGTEMRGSLVMLAAAVMWAWYAVLAKPLLAKYSPLKVTAYCHTLGGLLLIPLGLREALTTTPYVIGMLADPEAARHAFWVLFGLVFYAWGSGAYAFTVWYRGVQRLGSGRTMLYQFCVPVVGLAAAIVFRGEFPSALQWAGAALTLGGVAFALRRPQSRPRPAPQLDDSSHQPEAANAVDAAS